MQINGGASVVAQITGIDIPLGGQTNPLDVFHPALPVGARHIVEGRTPDIISLSFYLAAAAPHGLTQRALHTVPVGKACIIAMASCKIVRVTAAAPANLAETWIQIREGANLHTIARAALFPAMNGVLNGTQFDMPYCLFVDEGQQIEIYSTDASTGGTVGYMSHVVLHQIDK